MPSPIPSSRVQGPPQHGDSEFWDATVNQWVLAPASSGGGGPPVDVAYTHSQNIASATWTIVHNLSFYPNVSVVDSAGTQIFPGSITYPTPTTITITFTLAMGGFAYLS